jgi:4-amino-4-deoxy-L-arabinose transferase-like glycosyltransferase
VTQILDKVKSFLDSRPRARNLLPLLLVTALALAVYLPFLSASFDDFDSFNFARALHDFSPAAGNPHPPGYTLYIALSRIALVVTGNDRLALTALSALCAALSCGALFLFARTLFDQRVAWYAFGLVWLTPLMWLNAGKALSDTPGLLAQTVGMCCLALAVKRRAPLWPAGLVLGIAAGFRPQGVLGLTAALVLAGMSLRCSPGEWLRTALAAAAGALTWLLPLLAAFGGSWPALQAYLLGATGFVASQESLFSTALSCKSVQARWQEVWFWSSQAAFGPLVESLRAALFAGTVVGIAAAWRRKGKDIGVWMCLAWLAPQLLLQLLFLNPSLTRYLLALLFPVAVLVAVGLIPRPALPSAGLSSLLPRRLGLIVVLACAVVVGAATLPLAQALHTQRSPPEQLAAYVAQRFEPARTLVIARQSYNALLYHLPGWQVLFADYYGDAALEQEIARRQAPYVLIADPESLRLGEPYLEVETRTFARDPQIHAKHARVELNVYGLATDLDPRDLALPEGGSIAIGTPQDARYVLEGWYRREEVGGMAARWTGSAESAIVRAWLPRDTRTLTLRAVSFAPDQVLELSCDGLTFGRVEVPQNWSEIAVTVPGTCLRPEQVTHLTLHAGVLLSPASDGQSTDSRTLGVAIHELRFSP